MKPVSCSQCAHRIALSEHLQLEPGAVGPGSQNPSLPRVLPGGGEGLMVSCSRGQSRTHTGCPHAGVPHESAFLQQTKGFVLVRGYRGMRAMRKGVALQGIFLVSGA